jgi:tetratricopeptide (TPR) repeat protein
MADRPVHHRRRAATAFAALSLLLQPAGAPLAHGPGTDSAGNDRPTLIDRAGEEVPAYLLAAVCGAPGRAGEAGFERRVELARYLLARARQAPAPREAPPLLEGIGEYHRAVTTDSELAQRYFDQGMRLAFAFNHPEALLAFREARRLDPDCAMCWWGEAWVLGPNINAPMDPAAVPLAGAAIARARAAVGDDALERALVSALAERYATSPDEDRVALDRAWADAMADVAARFPEDADVLALYADALMNRYPWDYWLSDEATLRPALRPLVPTLEKALSVAPEHVFAIHLYIHALEASRHRRDAEPHADRLTALAPSAGHLVHMPSHLYVRIGRYEDSIAVNREAVAADEAYLAQTARQSAYRHTYYPHNVHFLLESARMSGDGETALAAAAKLEGLTTLAMARALPWVQLIDAAPFFAHAQFSPAEQVLTLERPAGELPLVVGAWHYARGVAFARLGRGDDAAREVDAISALAGSVDWDTRTPGIPGASLLYLAAHVVDGRIHQALGEANEAVAAFAHAVDLQDTLPYLEPPMWYYPVRQSLGAALLAAGRPDEAVAVFERGLENHPDQAWLLYGLHLALDVEGYTARAVAVRRRFEATWQGPPGGPALAEL